ncbi:MULTISPECIES: hypothetical protein [unclassified Pseudomonas]|uniref:hypothetical protein n=1 Tax=unclassified Pseudomonas TaxID=196821 RepID=UPI002447E7ED|nr:MULTISPECIES: hypothetical protein [unclassified Pseudomonas]MDG9926144.1 hypothetical protein [Pseudomonas sp. GD04045]MDH0037488.1 hypothetical protein [Pseudomonas sp. GD04019]
MNSNPITDAVGVLKLTDMHFNNPTAVEATTVRAAAAECIQRLEGIPAAAIQLAELYTALGAIIPRGWLPFVTLTNDPVRPLGAVITDEAGNIASHARGKTVDSLVALLRLRLPAGRGEAAA